MNLYFLMNHGTQLNQNSGVANSNLAQSSNELIDMGGTCSDFELYDETQGQTNENFVGDESEKDNLELIFHSQNLMRW